MALEPGVARDHVNLGVACLHLQNPEEAIAHYRTALELDPSLMDAYEKLGAVLVGLKRPDEAEKVFRAALHAEKDNPTLLRMMGTLLLRKESWVEGAQVYRRLLAAETGTWSDHYSLGLALLRAGQNAEAAAAFDRAVSVAQGSKKACLMIGVLWCEERQYARAIRVFRLGFARNPDDPDLANALAWVWATCPQDDLRNGPDAVRLAEAVNRKLAGRSAQVLDTLAAAYAEAGQFDQAVATAARALQAAQTTGPKSLVKEVQHRLRLYREGKPFREPTRAR
jgi:Tfp pilus assembly protein PilF